MKKKRVEAKFGYGCVECGAWLRTHDCCPNCCDGVRDCAVVLPLAPLSPGSVVVTREEAKVLRLAMKHARSADTDDSHTEGDLLNACAALRATKARNKR